MAHLVCIRQGSVAAMLALCADLGASPSPEEGVKRPHMRCVCYDRGTIKEKETRSPAEALAFIDPNKITWINFIGLVDDETMGVLERKLSLHPLVLGEIREAVPGRPRLMDLKDTIFLSLRILRLENDAAQTLPVRIVLGEGYVLSFVPEEKVFEDVLGVLGNDKARIRTMGADYLVYSLLDSVVEDYFTVSEGFGDRIEELQDEVIQHNVPDTLYHIQKLRIGLTVFRKAIWPLREALNTLEKGESDLVDDYSKPFFRDVYEHTVELMDIVDTSRDILSEMIDLYQTNVSNQLNAIVKVLTVISVIFAPLTFIVGLYGMNFQYMPELSNMWAYPAVLLLMLAISLFMLVLFRRKGWL